MSRLLEILGRGLEVDTADLIWHWLNRVIKKNSEDDGCESITERDFNEIVRLISERQLEGAEEKLKFHLFENPSCIKGRMAAAAIFLHRNQLPETIESLQSIYLRQPSNTMALYALGHCFERLDNETQAVEFYQDCLKFKHYLQLPRYRLGAIYFKNGQIDKTIQEYKLLTREYPDDTSSLVSLGHLYIANQEYGGAIEAFNNAILMHPDNFRSEEYNNEIDMLSQEGNIREVIAEVESRLEQEDDNPDLHVRLAELFTILGEDSEAVSHYEQALQSQPNSLVATIKFGTHYLRAQQHLSAAECFNRAVDINDQILEAYLGLAAAQKHGGSWEQAYSTLSLASAIQQNSILLFCQAATLHFHSTRQEAEGFGAGNDFGDLIKTVIGIHEKQLAEHPNNASAYYQYGLLLMGVGKFKEAVAAFQNALQANPTYHRARCKLVTCLWDAAKAEQAMHLLSHTEALSKEILELHYKTALLYCNRTKFVSAINKLQTSFKENFTEADAVINVSLVLQNLGLIDKATAAWQYLTETAKHTMPSAD